MRFLRVLMTAGLIAALAVCSAWGADGWDTSFDAEHLRLVNDARQNNGALAPVKMSKALSEAAKTRAKELVEFFDINDQNAYGMKHERPNGDKTPFTAIDGYMANGTSTGVWGTCSENIGVTFAPDNTIDSAFSGEYGWMNSSGHKANILKRENRFAGFGAYRHDFTDGGGESGTAYIWVELFSTLNPKGDTDIVDPSAGGLTFKFKGDAAYVNDTADTSDIDTGLVKGKPFSSIVKDDQNAGKFTLAVLTYGGCNFTKNWITNMIAQTRELKNASDVSVIIGNYESSAIFTDYIYSGEVRRELDTWKNLRVMRVNALQVYGWYSDKFGMYRLLNDPSMPGAWEGADTPLVILFYDNGIIDYNAGSSAANAAKQWENIIRQARQSPPVIVDDPTENPSENPSDKPEKPEPTSAPVSSDVQVVGSAVQTWNGRDTVAFTVSTTDQFAGVSFGGKDLTRMSDYMLGAGAGSTTVVTFTTSFLGSLQPGTHTMQIKFSGGAASVSVVVNSADVSASDSPSGDPSASASPSPSAEASYPPYDDDEDHETSDSVVTVDKPVVRPDDDYAVFCVNGAVVAAPNALLMRDSTGASVNVGGLIVLIRGAEGQSSELPVKSMTVAARAVMEDDDRPYAVVTANAAGGVDVSVPRGALFPGENELSLTGRRTDNGEKIATEPASLTLFSSDAADPPASSGKNGSGCDTAGAGLLFALALLGLVKAKR